MNKLGIDYKFAVSVKTEEDHQVLWDFLVAQGFRITESQSEKEFAGVNSFIKFSPSMWVWTSTCDSNFERFTFEEFMSQFDTSIDVGDRVEYATEQEKAGDYKSLYPGIKGTVLKKEHLYDTDFLTVAVDGLGVFETYQSRWTKVKGAPAKQMTVSVAHQIAHADAEVGMLQEQLRAAEERLNALLEEYNVEAN